MTNFITPTFTWSVENNLGLQMCRIPSGQLLVNRHPMPVESFFLGETPITQAQWREVASWEAVESHLNPDPSSFKGDSRPVESVNWFAALEFCRRLSQRTGRLYSLPTETQWKYACLAGTTTDYNFVARVLSTNANCNGEIGETTPVKNYSPNSWGLYDMHGNVWEWCLNNKQEKYNETPTNGSVLLRVKKLYEAIKKVLPLFEDTTLELAATEIPIRGGSWWSEPKDCSSNARRSIHPNWKEDSAGFRVCCN